MRKLLQTAEQTVPVNCTIILDDPSRLWDSLLSSLEEFTRKHPVPKLESFQKHSSLLRPALSGDGNHMPEVSGSPRFRVVAQWDHHLVALLGSVWYNTSREAGGTSNFEQFRIIMEERYPYASWDKRFTRPAEQDGYGDS